MKHWNELTEKQKLNVRRFLAELKAIKEFCPQCGEENWEFVEETADHETYRCCHCGYDDIIPKGSA